MFDSVGLAFGLPFGFEREGGDYAEDMEIASLGMNWEPAKGILYETVD